MFVYLSKKIAIPNNVKLNCIAWNKEHGYIAVAGTDGLLKVLKLDQAPATNAASVNINGIGQNVGALAGVSNLSLNQNLEGHKESVKVVVWNDAHQKLTSSDVNGVIMVWMLYKGSWYEEMTNDRKKSTVSGMHWTTDGSKICIVYEDGAIILGSVDGNRIWGKELKNTHFTGVQWSPDNRLLLFSLASGECHLYDNQGNFALKINIQCVNLSSSRHTRVASISWFSGKYIGPVRPTLAICYEIGKVQLMIDENDQSPIVLDCQMKISDSKWNHDGSCLAISGHLIGTLTNDTTKDNCNQVQFYAANDGRLIRVLKVPGNTIPSISWEGKSLRIAMAVDSFIYFANIRPEYSWCYFERTVVFLNPNHQHNNYAGSKQQIQTKKHLSYHSNHHINIITFWNTNSDQIFVKEVETCIGMAASNQYCVLAIECTNTNLKELALNTIDIGRKILTGKEKLYQLLLCNAIGTTVDSKYTDLEPLFVAMNSNYVIIASSMELLLWHYHTPKSASQLHKVKARKEKRFHINDPVIETEEIGGNSFSGLKRNFQSKSMDSIDSTKRDGEARIDDNSCICALAMSDELVLVARTSGVINEYMLPQLKIRNQYKTGIHFIHKMAINSNSSRVAIINQAGVMTLMDLDSEGTSLLLNSNRLERKDVWAICWARDNPQLLALMEKTRLYVFRGNDPEEPIACSGYLCVFEDLEITCVLLDDIISADETQSSLQHILQLKVKSLRDTDDLLQHVGLEDAKQFVEDNPHPRLWRLLGEAALKKLQLEMAEMAFVRCSDYQGIQLVKRLQQLGTEMLQKAEIAAFYGEFEKAEKLYIDGDRRDLAIALRITLCDWFRVVQLYRMGSGISDQQMETAWREIGHHFANQCSWESAKEYYIKSHYIEGLMDAYYHLEQFEELDQCIDKLSEKDPLLNKLAEMLASVGMCSEAVNAYLKYGEPKEALNTCVNLRQWDQAVQLAQRFKMLETVNTIIEQHSVKLLKANRLPEAIELHKKAGRFLEAARIMMRMAEYEIEKGSQLLRIKKLYILAALLTEEHLRQFAIKNYTHEIEKIQRSEIIALLNYDDSSTINKIWQCAEAYHFMLLAQRQLRFGIVHSAVVTALRLKNYDDILKVEDVYSVLALASCADRSFGICSKAFMKLESIENQSEEIKVLYEELAANIFSQYEPVDQNVEYVTCYACQEQIPDSLPFCNGCGVKFPPCVASGKPIFQPISSNIWMCQRCQHYADTTEIARYETCPLCHVQIIANITKNK